MIGQTVSHYNIVEKLGEGGMGVVYRAHDTRLDRDVALKFLSPGTGAGREERGRLLREARVAASLNHPNILSIFDVDEHEGLLFFVMEFVEGETLESKIAGAKGQEEVPLQKAIGWAIQVGQGLQAAHERNLVHQDITPGNIMVTGSGLLKIMDFGIAKLRETGRPSDASATVAGTLAYMSPEQLQGIETDARTDVWSLGVILYQLLTGETPFRAEHEAALAYLINNEDPLLPSSLDRRIPPALDACVKKMLEKDRDKRCSSIGEVLETLRCIQQDLAAAVQAKEQKAIALLPFENISLDKESDYFTDGLTEELIHNLSRLHHMRVVSRTSIMQYKNTRKSLKTIGEELGVGYVLEGSIRKFREDLRITVQLVDVKTDTQLWAEKYRGKLSDIFDIQEEVSREIVGALTVKLSPADEHSLVRRFTENPEAFDYNLRAREALYRMTKQDLKSAIQLFNRAIELDSHYPQAYAGLGQVYADLYFSFERKDIYLDKAIEACLKALSYDATLSDAYAALGLAYFDKKMLDEALTAVRKAIELDPNSFLAYWILGRIYHTTDRDREAIEPYRKVVELNPEFYAVHMDLRTVYERLNDRVKYDQEVAEELRVYPKYLARFPEDPRAHIFYAVALARSHRYEEGKAEAAKAVELNPFDPLMLYNTACFYAQIGEKRLALDTLKRSVSAGLENFDWIRRDPDLECIRTEPEYLELIESEKKAPVA